MDSAPTSQRQIIKRDDRAALIQRCRHWLDHPYTTGAEANDGHFLALLGVDAAPGVANYGGPMSQGSLPDRAYARAVAEADLQMALAHTPAPLRQMGVYSRTYPRVRGWYADATRWIARHCGAEWISWVSAGGWACHAPLCVLRGGTCVHSVDAALYACAESMAENLTEQWLHDI